MGTDQQQFCLRWHSYQSSLLATLPQLLDGNDLTDVTLSAGGRNLRAHKVILSACSLYFKELFKELQPFQHPVIVLPGMNYSDLCALVTFMYSGEVNIYQHQLSGLLSMADVLHIRGLSEVGSEAGNAGMDSLNPVLPTAKRDPKSPTSASAKRAKLSTVSPPSTHLTAPQDRERDLAAEKRMKESAVDYALYGKRTWDQAVDAALYTNGALPQEVAENLVTFDSKANLTTASQYQALTEKMAELYHQKVSVGSKKSSERPKTFDQTLAQIGSKLSGITSHADSFLRVKTEHELGPLASGESSSKTASSGKQALDKGDLDERKGTDFSPSRLFPETDEKPDPSTNQGLDLSQAVTSSVACTGTTTSSTNSCSNTSAMNTGNNNNNNSPNSKCGSGTAAAAGLGTTPSGHTKLYATCFVCGKQLSNQYNLRVHMETHQNVQYACSICSHVSRSKDALRKHVSYRHPVPVDGSNPSGGGGGGAAAKREARKLKEQLVAAAATAATAATATATSTSVPTSTTATLTPTPVTSAATSSSSSSTSTSTSSSAPALTTTSSASSFSAMETL